MDRFRSRPLSRGPRFAADLVYYAAHTVQPAHRHEKAQLSFLLAGCFAEDIDGRESRPLSRTFGYKPPGTAHAVQFGGSGALMLSIEFAEGADVAIEPCRWTPFGEALSRQLGLLALPVPGCDDPTDDILAALPPFAAEAERGLEAAPGWLRRALRHLAEDPSVGVAALAAEAGVHRVHLSRMFRRHTGLSPSEFRLQRKCAAAIKAMLGDGCRPAEAALAGGFADQAHLTRSIRAVAGIPPARIQRLLAA